MLLLLAVVSSVSTLTSRIGFGANRQFGNGTPPAGGNFQGNNGNVPGQGGNGNFQGNNGNFQGNNGNFQNRRIAGGFGFFNLFSLTRSLGLSFQVLGIINLVVPVLGIALLLVSAYGVWKQKKWGLNLATLLGLLFLLGALPGLFFIGGRNINWLRTGLTVLSALASLPILALSFLPSVRDYFPSTGKPKVRSVT